MQAPEDHKIDESDLFSNTMPATANQSTHQTHKAAMNFPFDLNNLFSMQYSFDTLKAAIEFLAK